MKDNLNTISHLDRGNSYMYSYYYLLISIEGDVIIPVSSTPVSSNPDSTTNLKTGSYSTDHSPYNKWSTA